MGIYYADNKTVLVKYTIDYLSFTGTQGWTPEREIKIIRWHDGDAMHPERTTYIFPDMSPHSATEDY
jgi:hypothetical protein